MAKFDSSKYIPENAFTCRAKDCGEEFTDFLTLLVHVGNSHVESPIWKEEEAQSGKKEKKLARGKKRTSKEDGTGAGGGESSAEEGGGGGSIRMHAIRLRTAKSGPANKYPCGQCGRRFRDTLSLEDHQKSHEYKKKHRQVSNE